MMDQAPNKEDRVS